MPERKNIYTCQKCRGSIVTVDIDEGVTPFMLMCRATADCKGPMQSGFYRVPDPLIVAGWEWYRPVDLSGLTPNERVHVEMGGLMLRKAGE